MAGSPLSIFRKYQYAFLVVFGVLLMIAFIVAPVISEWLASTARTELSGSGVVVTWRHGSITDSELARMRVANHLAAQFTQRLTQIAQEEGGQPRSAPIAPAQTDEQLVQTLVLARKAEQLGIVVTDEAIMSYLHEVSDRALVGNTFRFREILEEIGRGRFSEPQLFARLRTELLARQMQVLGFSGMYAVTPGAAWNYYNRLNRQITAELVPIAVSDFVDQVPDPSDDQVREFYEQYKDQYSHPSLPEPGFKQRRKIAFQYVKANLDEFLARAREQVTEEQIREYYENNKESFRALTLPQEGGDEPQDEPVPSDPGTAAPATEGTGEAPAADAATESPDVAPAEPVTNEPAGNDSSASPAGNNGPAAAPEANAAEETAPEASPATQEPATQEPATQEPAASEQGANPQVLSDRTVFVALQDDPADASAQGTESVSTEAASEAATQPAVETNEEAPASDAPGNQPQPEEPAPAAAPEQPQPQPGADEAALPATDETPDTAPADEAAASDAPAPYKPLEEVRDQIRDQLARPIAQDMSEEALKKVQAEVRRYGREYFIWAAQRELNPNAKKPASMDVGGLAQSLNLTAAETPLVDALEVQNYDLGQATTFDLSTGQFRMVSFPEVAFQEGVPLYTPAEIRSFQTNAQFVYWKVDEKEARVPPLNEIRDQVVQAWKTQQAVQLAQKRAEELAAQVAQSNQPLAQALAGEVKPEQVVVTQPFSWLTRGAVPLGGGQPTVTNLPNVEHAGNTFMESVFRLDVGEVGTAKNQPETMVYVVRVQNESPPEEVRRQQFLQTGMTNDLRMIAEQQQFEQYRKWYEGVAEEMQVQWVQAPSEYTGEI